MGTDLVRSTFMTAKRRFRADTTPWPYPSSWEGTTCSSVSLWSEISEPDPTLKPAIPETKLSAARIYPDHNILAGMH
jgi:hypothetical protein